MSIALSMQLLHVKKKQMAKLKHSYNITFKTI